MHTTSRQTKSYAVLYVESNLESENLTRFRASVAAWSPAATWSSTYETSPSSTRPGLAR